MTPKERDIRDPYIRTQVSQAYGHRHPLHEDMDTTHTIPQGDGSPHAGGAANTPPRMGTIKEENSK